ncbi:MAG: hypothetical protein JWM33_42 [Caulobacteraceae bacterium]|nr:hypothetical protein [Caulobacteraceae bacterium]
MRGAGWLAGVLTMLAAAPAVMAAPASSPAILDSMRLGLLGPIEDAPTAWGARAISVPNGFALPASTPGIASVPAPTTAPAVARAQAAPQAAAPPASPRAADQVDGLEVRANSLRPSQQTVEKCVTGPAWWRATKGSTTVWIMGTPEQMPLTTIWDDTCMRKRMIAAHATVVPAIVVSTVQDPFMRARTSLRQTTEPLNERLPQALWAQLSRRIDDNAIRADADAQWARSSGPQSNPSVYARATGGAIRFAESPPPLMGQGMSAAMLRKETPAFNPKTTLQVLVDTPNLYAPTLVVAERLSHSLDLPGRLGNPAAERAVSIAAQANRLVGHTAISEAQISLLTNLTAPSEDEQQICLKKVLDEMDAGHDARGNLLRVQAWAIGDLDNALPRMNVLNSCPFGEVGRRFWSALVSQYMQLIDRNTRQGGVTVAVVEFDPLLLKNGVLDRLKAEGFKVTLPEELQ